MIDNDKSVRFKDPFLEDAIRKAIKKPAGTICLSDLMNLKILDADSMDVTDLSGLEYCLLLTHINVYRNILTTQLNEHKYDSVKEYNPVTKKEEEWIPLEFNNIIPLTGLISLKNLSNLTDLQIGGNHIGDISDLSNLKSLKRLNIWKDKIEDIGPLCGLTNLVLLDASANNIEDIKPISGLTNLRSLNLAQNKIESIDPLSKILQLRVLELECNKVRDLRPISSLMSLVRLMLDDNRINDISPLSNLKNLRILSLAGNNINDLSSLTNMNNLKTLELAGTGISNIDALLTLCETRLAKLIYVGLLNNPLSDKTIRESIPHLRKIGVDVKFEHGCKFDRFSEDEKDFRFPNNVYMRDIVHNTPLHIYAMNGQLNGMQLLIDRGADINARNKQGLTPMHIAVSRRQLKIIEMLVSKGADTNIKDERGMTPIQLAKQENVQKEFLQILKRHKNDK